MWISTDFPIIFYLTLLLVGISFVQADSKGVDVSSLTSTSAFQCVKGQGYTRAGVRAYIEAWGGNPGGKVDANLVQNYNNAIAAGLSVDLYIFPCTGRSTCKSPATQASEAIDAMNANHMQIGTIWLDVEVDPQSNNWPDVTTNQNTLTAFKTALDDSKLNWGVYSSQSQWETVTGSTNWELDSSKPLWYAHYDNNPSFSDFTAFGGWTAPTAKQYAGDASLCGGSFDLNYYST
ncbi:glycoside hydrolase family 25 protein [Halteromyces radiatus]|uniref:glycoside hydrolase family 25 protein n=1 Tax=Halteromyces radiatus TaxID=101107 RepID=UPI0022209A4A|nr:glycoside hydrolase family 25 protein [Halteromyces radiatus]KAI8081285.1 glycoside hydrolase family 25 protein [Halteromyces radiatus]